MQTFSAIGQWAHGSPRPIALASVLLVACIHGHWPESPATDAPTGVLALHENELFARSPYYGDAWWKRADGGDAARAAEISDASAADECPSPTVRLVVSAACSDTCGPIEVLRNDQPLAVLLVADVRTSSRDLPEWARPPRRAAKEGPQGWRHTVVVASGTHSNLSLRSRCNARFAGGEVTAAMTAATCGESVMEVSCE